MTPATLDAPRTKAVSFTIARDALREALGKLAGAVGSGTRTIPVAQHVHLAAVDNRLTITATNFNVLARVSVSCEVTADGEALLPAKRLTEIVAALPPTGAVAITFTSAGATLTAGRSRFELQGLGVAEWPNDPTLDGAARDRSTASATAFLDALDRVLSHASTEDEARPALSGVRMDPVGQALRCAGHDGFRLARLDVPITGALPAAGCTIPRAAVSVLTRVFAGLPADATLTIGTDGTHLIVESADAQAIVRLISESFPDYESALTRLAAATTRTVTVDRRLLSAAIKRVALVAGDTRRIAVTLDDDIQIRAAAADVGTGSDVVPIDARDGDTDALTFEMNARFATDALDAIESQLATLVVATPLSPILFRDADSSDAVLVLVQPLHPTPTR